MEHGTCNLETAHDMIRASLDTGITPIVRVGELAYSLVSRLLDGGAQGIILPRVEVPRVLEEALAWMRFPPVGKRGYGVNPTMVGYEARTFPEIIEHQNSNTLAVVQFETVTAMERADELLSVAGMDIAMVGPADLSISLGIPDWVHCFRRHWSEQCHDSRQRHQHRERSVLSLRQPESDNGGYKQPRI